jgi:hypothetical protein
MKTLNDGVSGAVLARKVDNRVRPLRKSEVRRKYRLRKLERAEKSASLAIMYPQLKTLTADLLYFDREIVSWGHGLRYRANLETAKSELHFSCPSALCHRGGFNLSDELSSAVGGRRKLVDGQVHCQGSRDLESGKTVPCESILHFRMILTFKTSADTRRGTRVRGPAVSEKRSSPIRSRYCE